MADNAKITGGGRFAMVPVAIIEDPAISLPARWWFTVLCGYANRDGFCKISQTRVAKQQGITKRSLTNWTNILENAGYVIRHSEPGKSTTYRLLRDPDERAELNAARERETGQAQAPTEPSDSSQNKNSSEGERELVANPRSRQNENADSEPPRTKVPPISGTGVNPPSPEQRNIESNKGNGTVGQGRVRSKSPTDLDDLRDHIRLAIGDDKYRAWFGNIGIGYVDEKCLQLTAKTVVIFEYTKDEFCSKIAEATGLRVGVERTSWIDPKRIVRKR